MISPWDPLYGVPPAVWDDRSAGAESATPPGGACGPSLRRSASYRSVGGGRGGCGGDESRCQCGRNIPFSSAVAFDTARYWKADTTHAGASKKQRDAGRSASPLSDGSSNSVTSHGHGHGHARGHGPAGREPPRAAHAATVAAANAAPLGRSPGLRGNNKGV
ncbi:Protein of unknown function [Gryllus bimaculatus]|nr:Protein of unknown function [Gryllus bimaculatus]